MPNNDSKLDVGTLHAPSEFTDYIGDFIRPANLSMIKDVEYNALTGHGILDGPIFCNLPDEEALKYKDQAREKVENRLAADFSN